MPSMVPPARRGLIGLVLLLVPLAYGNSDSKEAWVEVRSPDFIVASNAGEKQARQVARQFEEIRSAYHEAIPTLRLDLGKPIVILAVKNENSMKALLPGYWEQKGHVHPAGIYVHGEEKHYVALRTDAEGENPYHTVYHEYTHALMHVNFPPLPLWLDEGLAEFYGNTEISEKEFRTGRADSGHLQLLQQSKLIPVDVLLQVDHGSPYYNEQNRASVFYAESWALVHFLMLDPYARKEQLLMHFLEAWQKTGNQVEAARQSFGDLKRFADRIESYARQSAFYAVRLKSSVQANDKGYESRLLPAGESLALRGDFHLHMGRPTEARAMLEEALQQDPNLAAAHEGLGSYYFRQHDMENAGKELQRATELNAKSYLTYYYAAMLNLQQRGETSGEWGTAEANLEKAIALNPNFAPAYANLAALYSMRREAQEKALSAAQRASQLEPGTVAYSVTLGYVLMNMNRNEEARVLAARLVAAAKTPTEISSAKAFQENVETRLRFQAQFPAPTDSQMDASDAGLAVKNDAGSKVVRANETTNMPPAAAMNRSDMPRAESSIAPKPAAAEPVTSGRVYEMSGKVTVLDCSRAPEVTLTLNLGFVTMKLHSADFSKIMAKDPLRAAKTTAAVCATWKGRSAKMSYHLTPGQAFDGELTAVHFF